MALYAAARVWYNNPGIWDNARDGDEMTRAIFFDIDGTLRSFKGGGIAQSTLDALHALRAREVKLFIATGRGIPQTRFLEDIFRFDGYVAQNGQYCLIDDEVVRMVTMDAQDVRTLIDGSRRGAFSCFLETADDMVLTYEDDNARAVFRLLDLPAARIMPPDWDASAVIKGIVFVDRVQETELKASLRRTDTFRWHPLFCDVGRAGGGKDVGMDAVLAHLGIPLEQTMAFGDGENDLAMLRHAAVGVAMGNASDTVKAAADYVTDSVDEDGVANALRHFGLI